MQFDINGDLLLKEKAIKQSFLVEKLDKKKTTIYRRRKNDYQPPLEIIYDIDNKRPEYQKDIQD